MNDENNNPDTQEVNQSSPGTMLRTAREAREMTIKHIASQLRLRKDVIEDLEHDRFERLPAPIFVRGYIRSYAALVGLDPAYVNASYEQYSDHTEQEIDFSRSTTKGSAKLRRQNIVPFVIAGLVITLGVILWYSQKPDASNPGNADTAITQADPQQTELDSQMQVPSTPAQVVVAAAEVSETEIAEQVQPQAVTDEVMKNEPQQENVSQQAADVETAAVADEQEKPRVDRLEFVFSGDSWVDVSDSAGKRLIYRMVKSGVQRTVSGMPPFKITLGNAPQTQLLRNGEVVDLKKYTRGNVAKFSLGKINE